MIDFDSTHPNYLLSIIASTGHCISDRHALEAELWTPERVARLQALAREIDALWKDLNAEQLRRYIAA